MGQVFPQAPPVDAPFPFIEPPLGWKVRALLTIFHSALAASLVVLVLVVVEALIEIFASSVIIPDPTVERACAIYCAMVCVFGVWHAVAARTDRIDYIRRRLVGGRP